MAIGAYSLERRDPETRRHRDLFCLTYASGALRRWTNISLADRGTFMDLEITQLQALLADEGTTGPSEDMVVGESPVDHSKPEPQAEGSNNPVGLVETEPNKEDKPLPHKSGSAARTGGTHKRLSGAAKKRIRRWMAVGKSFQEARALCLRPLDEFPDIFPEFRKARAPTTRIAKRPREEASTSPSPDHQRGKIPNTQPSPSIPPLTCPPLPTPLTCPPPTAPSSLPNYPIPPPPTFREAASSIRVGVENSTRPMTDGELNLVKKAILKLSDGAPKGEGPNFSGCAVRAGWLLLICADERTKNWLSANISRITPWEGATLRVSETLPKPRIGVAWIPDQEVSQETVLHRFETQNPGIDCSLWRVLGRRVEGNGQTMTFSMDEASCETIQGKNGKLFIGFGSVQFRIKRREQQEAGERGNAQAADGTKRLRTTADPMVPGGATAAPQTSSPAPPSNIASNGGGGLTATPRPIRDPRGPFRPS